MFSIQTRFIWAWLLLIAGVLISCSPGSTPPGASSIGGGVDGGSYSYHYWAEGLAVLLWQDASYGSGQSCSGSGSTQDAVYRLECTLSGPAGHGYQWELHTTDGVTGDMWIEEQRVDLAKGAMFLVTMGEDGVQVEQLQRDLSTLERSNEAISALATADGDVARFINGLEAESGSLDINDEVGLVTQTDSVVEEGPFVETSDPVDQPVDQGQPAPLPPPDTATLLGEAFAAADYEALQAMMGESFAIGYWRSEGQRLTPDQAVEQLRLNLLPDPGSASFIRDRALFPDLGGIDPFAVFGPDAQIVDLVYSQGWGGEGLDEAILTIAQDAGGDQYWHGILTGRFNAFPVAPVHEPASDDSALYRNSENGFELGYPASWHLDEQVLGSRGSAAAFYLAATDEEPVLSAVVYLWDPKHDLDAWLELRKPSWTNSGASLLSEEALIVADGHRAVRFEVVWPGGMKTNHLLTEVGDRYLEINGSGDRASFDEIIGTLKLDAPGA